MLRSVDLSDYMQHNPVKISIDDSLDRAVELIIEHRVSGLCAVDANDALRGVLSEMDCLKAALATLNEATSGVVIGDCMLLHPIKIHPEDDLFTAIKAIIDNRVSGLCVVDEGEKLLGVLSEMDCLRAILSAIYNDHREVGRVSEHMTTDVESCDAGADMIAVATDMLSKGRRRRPVLDGARLIGQITCRQMLFELYRDRPHGDQVQQHMNPKVDACQLHADIVSIANDMLIKGRRRRPVIDDGRLVGQITCRQLLRVVSEFNRNQVAANFDSQYRDLL
jgi:CBS domain-containing protein